MTGLLFLIAPQNSSAQFSFDHVVVIVQENRTPDNLFQGLCTAPFGISGSCSTTPTASEYNIQTANWLDNTSVSGIRPPTAVALNNKYDLGHSSSDFEAMCDAVPGGQCRMDGAAKVACVGACPKFPAFRFVQNTKGILNPYLDLATDFGWANYMFQTNRGPSFPAHQFLFGGTSAPSAADDANGTFAAGNVSKTRVGGLLATAGCIAPVNVTVRLIDAAGQLGAEIYPCFEHQTLPDELPSIVTWRYYALRAGSIWTAPNAIQHICVSSGPGGTCTGALWSANVDLSPADVLRDIQKCNLASISWVTPIGQNSDHANVNDGGGPSWVASIVNAIGHSTTCDGGKGYWMNTAIIVTWDDWGGWYDHEPPTTLPFPQGGYQYGFRVPLIVVSAYTHPGTIVNSRLDFGSILRFIEGNFGVAQGVLGFADARAKNSLDSFFNFQVPPRPFSTIGAPKGASFFLHDKRAPADPDDD